MQQISGRDVNTGQPVTVLYDERIRQITSASPSADLPWLAPGLVDLQVNGFGGIDFNRPETTLAELELAVQAIHRTGVTRFLPTVITGPPADMVVCLRNLAKARSELNSGRSISGFHVEGPHIAPEDGPRGAHPLASVRPPDLDEYRRWQEATDGGVRLITLSPHWTGALEYIRQVTRDGVTASIGHTIATSAQIGAAIDAGATLSTHLGNAGHPSPNRYEYLWEQFIEDRLSASFIADGIHLSPAFLRLAMRVKTPSRSVLVTDAAAPAGAPPGRYRLGEQAADLLPDGRVVLAGTDRLAGSSLQMHDAIANMLKMTGVTLAEAFAMATTNPAKIVCMEGRMAGLTVGERADFITFRYADRLEVQSAFVDGVPVV